MKKKMIMKKMVLLALAAVLLVSAMGCGKGESGSSEDVEYSLFGNYVYRNADGGTTDEEGAEWHLFIDSETKFHLVGIKRYENAGQSIRIDEGQIVSVSGYTCDLGFTPYSSFGTYIHHGAVDEEVSQDVLSTKQAAITDYQNKTGDEFFQIELTRTSNSELESGTFTVVGDASLSWGAWHE